MVKKILIVLAAILIVIIVVVFFYRQAIIQYSVEKIVRGNLPAYIKFDKINFDIANNKAVLTELKILNPPGFSAEDLIKIGSITCEYRLMGGWIPDGLEITKILIKQPYIFVERLKDGRINLVEMGNFVKTFPAAEPKDQKGAGSGRPKSGASNKKLSAIIKLPAAFGIMDGTLEFWDRLPYNKAHLIEIGSVNGNLDINFNDNYSKILNLAFTFDGDLNGAKEATIKWIASLDPNTPRLTMSNRFEVANLDILSFEPYYDQQSPFVFRKGKFSGTLVFDFNNGEIGSTNEIRLSNLSFNVKPGYENSQMWETNVQDLMKYFTTISGDVVFDFKIKGDMAKPSFYLGPISKRALTAMAIDKISSYASQAVTKNADGATQQINKTKDYVDLIRGFINKK